MPPPACGWRLRRAPTRRWTCSAASDGFLGNPKVRIPLPGLLDDAAKLLKATGQQKRVDELVTAMNRAAEAAVPEATRAAGRMPSSR